MCLVQSSLFKDVNQMFDSLIQEAIFKDLESFQIQSSVDLDFKDKMAMKFLNLISKAQCDQFKLDQYKTQQSISVLQILFALKFIAKANTLFQLFRKPIELDSELSDQILKEF